MKTLNALTVLTLACVLLQSGCVKLWQDNLDIKTYLIQVERTEAPRPSPVFGKLWIEDIHVLPPYNVRSLAVRESDVEYSTSYYTELLISPAENFRNGFYGWFSASGLFSHVTVTDRRGACLRLVGTVMDFYGDRETNEAVLRLKVTLFDEDDDILLHEEYAERTPIEADNAEGLVRAYNVAFEKILTVCEKDIAGVSAERRSAP